MAKELSCLIFTLKGIHQLLIFCDELWTSLSFGTLAYKKLQYQLGGSLHDILRL